MSAQSARLAWFANHRSTCCSVLQCVAALQFVLVCCSVLQCDANVLQSTWFCKTTQHLLKCVAVLQCVQCVAVCCSVLQCVAVCCSVLQCVAVCCSVLQCVAWFALAEMCVAVCCSSSCDMPRCMGEACCSVLHEVRVAVCCTRCVLQCVAVAHVTCLVLQGKCHNRRSRYINNYDCQRVLVPITNLSSSALFSGYNNIVLFSANRTTFQFQMLAFWLIKISSLSSSLN